MAIEVNYDGMKALKGAASNQKAYLTGYNDTRVRIGTVFMIGIGLLMAAGYVLLALSNDLPGLLSGVPFALAGVACVWMAHRRWVGATGERGGGGMWMFLGSVLIIGSLWAAFMIASALE